MAGHDVSVTATTVARYLEQRGFGRRVQVTDLECDLGGGGRVTVPLTATVRTAAGERTRRLVLRLRNRAAAPTPLDVETEYELLEALSSSPVPAPKPLFVERDESVLGSEFFATSYESGVAPDVFRRSERQWLNDQWTSGDRSLPRQFVETLAAIHSVDPGEVPVDPVRPATVVDEQLSHWREQYERTDTTSPVFEEAVRWLETNRPDATESTLVHGDYRVGNLLVADRAVSAVVDWELARVTDPAYDLGFTSLRYFAGQRAAPVERPDLVSGLAEREWLYDEYERVTGRSVDRERVRYWRAFVLFAATAGRLLGREDPTPRPTSLASRYCLPAHLADLLALVRGEESPRDT